MQATEFRYSETADKNFTEVELTAMNLTELKDLFNAEVLATHPNPSMFKPIAKFSSKEEAVRRVFARLTVITPDQDDQDNEDINDLTDNSVNHDVSNENTDIRLDQVTCATCQHTDRKGNMTIVGSNWYCTDEDACQARLNPTTEPNEHNAPTGMVFCGLCKQHVPADTAEPTADVGIYTCKELCIGKKANSLRDKAKAASTKAKAERKPRQPKTTSTRQLAHPNDHVITFIADCPKKKGSKAEKGYELYRIGMTVAEYLKSAQEHDCYGREGLKYDVEHGYIKIEAPAPSQQA